MTRPSQASRTAGHIAAALMAAAVAGPAQAQPLPSPLPPPGCAVPPPLRFLRYLEEFEAFRDPACRTQPQDAMKYIVLDEGGQHVMTLGADMRLVLVNARYLSFGTEGDDNHNVRLQRYHAHASLRLSGRLRVFAELKSNRQQGREPVPLGADVDRLDIHQAFVDLGVAPPALLRIGRQELLYGSGRRIFPRNGPNVRGSFDAVRWITRAGGWQADAFVFRPVAVDPGTFDDDTVDTQTLFGGYATGTHRAFSSALLDAYYIGAHRKGSRFEQGVATERRHTAGARVSSRGDAWDHDHEASLQWGRFGAGRINAWAIAGETGYTWRDATRRPRASLRVSVGSGDRDPADASLQTFHSHFPRGGAVDEGFNVSAANMSHARAAFGWQLLPAVEGVLAVNTQRRTSRRDGVYGPGGGLIRPTGGSLARHVGDGIDVNVTWTISRHAALDVGAGYFFSGRFVAQSGLDRNMAYLTPTLRLRF
jgi:hypothetical protein